MPCVSGDTLWAPIPTEMSLILSCPLITTRGQPRNRNFMPRIHGGPKASSPPLRQWAGEPHSWCMSPQVGAGQALRSGVWGCPAVRGAETQTDWPASLRESADKVVLHMGKYEELIVCSHEIAASTAQLVAASKVSEAALLPLPPPPFPPAPGRPGLGPTQPCPRCPLQVKADKHSPHLSRLQECSRTVNERAASVVASTKSGQEQIEDRGECLGTRGASQSGWGSSLSRLFPPPPPQTPWISPACPSSS